MELKINKPITHEQFLADVKDFCRLYGISERNIGLRALNDTAFVGRIRAGKSPTLVRVEAVYDFMMSYADEREHAD